MVATRNGKILNQVQGCALTLVCPTFSIHIDTFQGAQEQFLDIRGKQVGGAWQAAARSWNVSNLANKQNVSINSSAILSHRSAGFAQ